MHSIAVIEDDLDNLNLNLNEFEVFEHVHLTLEWPWNDLCEREQCAVRVTGPLRIWTSSFPFVDWIVIYS